MNIKEQYYKYGESLGIKVNDLQRLKMLSDKFQNDALDNQTVTNKMEKIIKLTELRKLNTKVSKGEITALQMVEEINEKAFKVYVLKLEKIFEELKHYQAINENKQAFIEQLETKIEYLTAENQSYERELNEKLINENHAFHFYRMGRYGGFEVSFDWHYKEYLNQIKNESDKK